MINYLFLLGHMHILSTERNLTDDTINFCITTNIVKCIISSRGIYKVGGKSIVGQTR